MLTTVREQEAMFTKKGVMRAREARKMVRRVGYPSETAVIKTINAGSFLNCPTQGKDFVLAEDL